MYPIRIIAAGKTRLEGCRELERHYVHLLRVFARMDIEEIQEGRGEDARALLEEAERFRRRLAGVTHPVLLDAEGLSMDSRAFAGWLGARMDRGASIAFVIGSSRGFDPSFRSEIKERLSLSPLTLPHDVARVVLLEQLYRACTILKGKTYHK